MPAVISSKVSVTAYTSTYQVSEYATNEELAG
jgi:hypothetical protein